MKAGARAVGVAESYGAGEPPAVEGTESTMAAVVVRADRVVDGMAFGTCTVGGTDGTEAVAGLVSALDREDVGLVFVAGIAPAWYNVLDLPAVEAAAGRPVVSVSFEASSGLDDALSRAFEGEELEERRAVYERQPTREAVPVNGETVYVRVVGADPAAAREAVRAFTPEGGRPEPLRVARLAARAADRWRPAT